MFPQFSHELRIVINGSKNEMRLLNHSYIGTEHIVLSILKLNNRITLILNKLGINYNLFKDKVINLIGIGDNKDNLFVFTPLLKKIMDDVIIYSNNSKIKEVSLPLFFSFLLDYGEGVAYRIFLDLNIDIDKIYEMIDVNNNVIINDNYLNDYGVLLTDYSFLNKCFPLIGRESEIDSIIAIMLRKMKSNPLLIGDAGVGKTAIIEELARRIYSYQVPMKLFNKKIYSISMASLVSGTKYRGEFEEKLLNIINYAETHNIIIFIDEIHTLVGAGGAEGAIDASNILKPALSRGNITIIGATTKEEYKKYIENDKALSRRFQNVYIDEPNSESLFKIIIGIKASYENYHNVKINNEIVNYIINCSNKYYYKKEPDKTIDLIDEICSYWSSKPNRIQKENMILIKDLYKVKMLKENALKKGKYDLAINLRKNEREIESLINNNDIKLMSNNSKIFITKKMVNQVIYNKANMSDYGVNGIKSVLKSHIKELKKYVIGQSMAIESIVNICKKIINISPSNYSTTILLTGNRGVGKTYLSKKIGEIVFNNNYLYIDLYECNSFNPNNKCIFEKIRWLPILLIIFDNYDKASFKIKEDINKIMKDKYYETFEENKYYFNTCLFIVICDKKESVIGFNEGNKIIENDYFDIKIQLNDLSRDNILKIIKNYCKSRNININNKDIDSIINNINYRKEGANNIEKHLRKYML